MPSVSSILGELVTAVASKTTRVEFDANLNEVVTVAANVTSYPVEDGSNISDNVVDEPDEIQIDAVITNTPANIDDTLLAATTRAEDKYDGLLLLKMAGDVVSVFTSAGEYTNMIITRLARTRNASVGEAAQFSISLRKIRKVQSSVAEVPLRKKGGKGAKKNLGTVVDKPADKKLRESGLLKIGKAVVRVFTGG